MTTTELGRLVDIVVDLARSELLPRFAMVERREKADGSVVTEVDLAMQQRLALELEKFRPGTALLGEEMSVAEQTRLLQSEQAIWCLDPLDGTSNFVAGIPYFCVSLALLRRGKTQLGIVYDPVRDECFTAIDNGGAALNGRELVVPPTGLDLSQAVGLIDLKRLPDSLAIRLVIEKPCASQRSFGSVALDWCWLAAGRAHVYLHGKQQLWDYAAGSLILREAGGYAMTLAGAPIPVDVLKPCSAVAALDQGLFDEWIAWLGIEPRDEQMAGKVSQR